MPHVTPDPGGGPALPASRAGLRHAGPDRRRISALLQALETEPLPPDLDIKPLKGHTPWLRARVGPWRVIYRALTLNDEVGTLPARGHYVGRIVRRRDLEQTVDRL